MQEPYADEHTFQDFGPPSAPPIAPDGGIFDAVGERSDHFLLVCSYFLLPGRDN